MSDNELIAEFMGHTKDPEYNYWVHAAAEKSTNYRYEFRIYKFTYHISWDELMPVVEKIGRLSDWNFTLNVGASAEWEATFYDSDFKFTARGKVISAKDYSGLTAIYKAVVEFIKWYKETTDQTVQ